MTKRLQVLLDEKEFRELRRVARAHRMTVAAWVRQTLRVAQRREPSGEAEQKIAVVRAGARHAFPTAEIDDMLREIDQGYLGPGAQ